MTNSIPTRSGVRYSGGRTTAYGVLSGAAMLALLSSPGDAAELTSTFLNGTNNWSNASSWSPVGVPSNNGTNTYDVVFNGTYTGLTPDTIKLDNNYTIQKLTMTGGFLSGPSTSDITTLTLNNTLNWSGGIIGLDTVNALVGGSIAATSTCEIGTGTVANYGTTTYTATFVTTADGQAALRLDSNGTFANEPTGTFNIAGDVGISETSGTANFSNQGLFQKTSGTGVSNIAANFTDTGTVDALTGTLKFYGGTNSHTGTVEAAAGAAVDVGGTSIFTASSTFGGDGTLLFDQGGVVFSGTILGGAGPLQVIGNSQAQFAAGANVSSLALSVSNGGRAVQIIGSGLLDFNTGNTVSIASLTGTSSNSPMIMGGTDDIKLTGPSSWYIGTFNAPTTGPVNTLYVEASMTLTGSIMDHRTLQHDSTLTLPGNAVSFRNGANLSNSALGTIDLTTDGGLNWTGNGALPTFNNAGLFEKTAGTGQSYVMDVRLVNTGTVMVSSGTLILSHSGGSGGGNGWADSGVNSGIFDPVGSGVICVYDFTMDASSTVEGSGTMQFGGNIQTVAGTYNMSGTTLVSNTVQFIAGAKVLSAGHLLDVVGQASFNTGNPVTLQDVQVDGTLNSTDPVTIFGTVSGSGKIILTSLTIPGNISPGDSPGTLAIQGSVTMTSTTTMDMQLGGNYSSSYDELTTTGVLTLDGNLALSTLDGYLPAKTT